MYHNKHGYFLELLQTIISSFIGILFYNIKMNPINFINTLVEEHLSVIVEANKDLKYEKANKDLRYEIKNEDNVKLLYIMMKIILSMKF